jgi:hypothetical protein
LVVEVVEEVEGEVIMEEGCIKPEIRMLQKSTTTPTLGRGFLRTLPTRSVEVVCFKL